MMKRTMAMTKIEPYYLDIEFEKIESWWIETDQFLFGPFRYHQTQ